MKKIITIAVLITCHNRKDKTIKCLDSLFSQKDIETDFTIQVFLVDDGSTDGTAEAIQAAFPQVQLIKGNGSLFWNRGMHLAWEVASRESNPDFYLWLNDDTFLYPQAIKNLIEGPFHKSIICGTTEDVSLNKLSYGGYDKKHNLIIPNNYYQKCEYFNGNIVLISNAIFRQLGNLDSYFRHALGDFDYGLRARNEGICLFISREVIGSCELHKGFPIWCNIDYSILERVKNFSTPLGISPRKYFYFDKRHNGFVKAIFHFFTIHLRLIFPRFWY